MLTTKTWAKSHGISVALTPPAIKGYSKKYPRSARQVALPALALQGVVAAACKIDPDPVIAWFQEQGIWKTATGDERAFLRNRSPTKQQRNEFCWHQEAEWTLLWVIGKVDSLGLPIAGCDTRRLVDEIIPPLGSNIEKFLRNIRPSRVRFRQRFQRPPGSIE
jgi:hypothetical protein